MIWRRKDPSTPCRCSSSFDCSYIVIYSWSPYEASFNL